MTINKEQNLLQNCKIWQAESFTTGRGANALNGKQSEVTRAKKYLDDMRGLRKRSIEKKNVFFRALPELPKPPVPD